MKLGDAMTRRKRQSIRGVLLGIALALAPLLGARAQDAGPTSGWSFQLTPYLWLAGISGDVAGPRGSTASFDAGIGDVLSHLQGGLMVLGEARYQRWGILVDFDYAKLSGTGGGFTPILGQPSLTTKEYLVTLDGAYRFINSDAFKLDALAGVRIMSIDNELSFSGALLPPRSDNGGATWADPVVGLRTILPIGGGFVANALGDVGGGPNGDLTWQIYGGIGYEINKSISASVGYRYLSMNHQDGNFKFDINQQGPLLGVGFRF
jgi:opacity protein-like surface antigen